MAKIAGMAGIAGGSVIGKTACPVRPSAGQYGTRRQRRRALAEIIEALEAMKAAEEACRDNTPENLQNSSQYEDTEAYIECFEEGIDTLKNIY